MRIAGGSVLHASPDKVFAAITDPEVLAGVIPGCDTLTPLGEHHFALAVTLGVAAIKGSYAGEVRFADLQAPQSLTMRAAGSGGPGTVDTTVTVRMADLGDGTTQLDYEADATVGGMIGGVGQRVLAGVAKKTAGQFFSAIDDVLTGKALTPAGTPSPGTVTRATGADPTQTAEAQSATAQGDTFGRTLAPAPASGAPSPVPLLGAAAFGALSMLVGVIVGARIGRRR